MIMHRACNSVLLLIALSGGLAAWAGITPTELKALVAKNAQGMFFIDTQAVDAREMQLRLTGGGLNDLASMINEYRRTKGRVDQKNRAIADRQKQGLVPYSYPQVYILQREIDVLLRERNDLLKWGNGLADTIRFEFKSAGVILGDKALSDLSPLQEQSSLEPSLDGPLQSPATPKF